MNGRSFSSRMSTALAILCGLTTLVAACGGGQEQDGIELSDKSFSTNAAMGKGKDAYNAPTEPYVDSRLVLPPAEAPLFTEPPAGTSDYQRHLDTATANAGTEFAGEQRKQWCWSVENSGFPPEFSDTSVVPMTKLFDNLYYAGRGWVGQYVLKTRNGYFLLDGQNTMADAAAITVPGLEAVGIDPRTLMGSMPTHGHGDHYVGLKYMQDNFGGPVFVGSADAAALTSANPRNVAAFAGSPTPSIVTTTFPTDVLAPQTINVDGIALTVLSTPGHTSGTVSGILPARWNGRTHKLIYWGGTGTPTTLPLAIQYLDGTERLYALAQSEKVDGTIHTHAFVDGSLAKIRSIATGTVSGKNPFLMGNASTLRSLSVLRECAAAKVNALDATATNPVWLTTTVEAVGSSIGSRRGAVRNVSALFRLSDPYGPVSNATITLRVAGSNDTCSATTSDDGTGSCGFLTRHAASGKTLEVRFEGTASEAKVWLASATTVKLK